MKPSISIVALVAFAVLAGAAYGGASHTIPGVRSPSGNIECLFVPTARGPVQPPNLLCTIARASYTGALQRRCQAPPTGLDWHGFELPALRRGQVSCSGGILYDQGTQRPAYTTLAYGATWRHGPFTCTSRRTGLTCVTAHGHGLFLSRASWRAW
jgi:hypothetical protein